MHPAPSIIIFTSLSGLGFGLMIWIGLGFLPSDPLAIFFSFTLAFVLCGAGLSASVFHLGNPKNVLKSFSQWRTSWLSREGILSIITLDLIALHGFFLIFFDWNLQILGVLGALFAFMSVFATAMIYAQLATVPRWHTRFTPLLFLSLSLLGGSLLAGAFQYAVGLLILSAGLQLLTWLRGDRRFTESGSTTASATGLGGDGKTVRMFEAPHTGNNYLLKEMVYELARKQSKRLRIIGFTLAFLLPFALLVGTDHTHLSGLLALVAHVGGLLISRWLFFAEAEHVVGLYYGRR